MYRQNQYPAQPEKHPPYAPPPYFDTGPYSFYPNPLWVMPQHPEPYYFNGPMTYLDEPIASMPSEGYYSMPLPYNNMMIGGPLMDEIGAWPGSASGFGSNNLAGEGRAPPGSLPLAPKAEPDDDLEELEDLEAFAGKNNSCPPLGCKIDLGTSSDGSRELMSNRGFSEGLFAQNQLRGSPPEIKRDDEELLVDLESFANEDSMMTASSQPVSFLPRLNRATSSSVGRFGQPLMIGPAFPASNLLGSGENQELVVELINGQQHYALVGKTVINERPSPRCTPNHPDLKADGFALQINTDLQQDPPEMEPAQSPQQEAEKSKRKPRSRSKSSKKRRKEQRESSAKRKLSGKKVNKKKSSQNKQSEDLVGDQEGKESCLGQDQDMATFSSEQGVQSQVQERGQPEGLEPSEEIDSTGARKDDESSEFKASQAASGTIDASIGDKAGPQTSKCKDLGRFEQTQTINAATLAQEATSPRDHINENHEEVQVGKISEGQADDEPEKVCVADEPLIPTRRAIIQGRRSDLEDGEIPFSKPASPRLDLSREEGEISFDENEEGDDLDGNQSRSDLRVDNFIKEGEQEPGRQAASVDENEIVSHSCNKAAEAMSNTEALAPLNQAAISSEQKSGADLQPFFSVPILDPLQPNSSYIQNLPPLPDPEATFMEFEGSDDEDRGPPSRSPSQQCSEASSRAMPSSNNPRAVATIEPAKATDAEKQLASSGIEKASDGSGYQRESEVLGEVSSDVELQEIQILTVDAVGSSSEVEIVEDRTMNQVIEIEDQNPFFNKGETSPAFSLHEDDTYFIDLDNKKPKVIDLLSSSSIQNSPNIDPAVASRVSLDKAAPRRRYLPWQRRLGWPSQEMLKGSKMTNCRAPGPRQKTLSMLVDEAIRKPKRLARQNMMARQREIGKKICYSHFAEAEPPQIGTDQKDLFDYIMKGDPKNNYQIFTTQRMNRPSVPGIIDLYLTKPMTKSRTPPPAKWDVQNQSGSDWATIRPFGSVEQALGLAQVGAPIELTELSPFAWSV